MNAEHRLTYVDSSAIVELVVAKAVTRGEYVLRRIQLLQVNDRVLREAGRMEPADLRSLDAIHLASARQLGPSVRQIVTYDERMAEAARASGWSVAAPS
jgi:predicted nucleic acid-binding protein